jgi:hypothetical protein
MNSPILRFALVWGASSLAALPVLAQECLECHNEITPNIVSDWQLSKHSQNAVECSDCHASRPKRRSGI